MEILEDPDLEMDHKTEIQHKGLKEALSLVPSAQCGISTVTIGQTRGETTIWYQCDACGAVVERTDCHCRNCGRNLKFD